VPKVPRISLLAISEVYCGTITEYEPLANPVKSLPIQIITTLENYFLNKI